MMRCLCMMLRIIQSHLLLTDCNASYRVFARIKTTQLRNVGRRTIEQFLSLRYWLSTSTYCW